MRKNYITDGSLNAMKQLAFSKHRGKINARWCAAICKGWACFASEYGSGRSVARLARLLGVQEVASSNLAAPTILTSAKAPIAVHGRAIFSTSKEYVFRDSGVAS